MIESQKQATDKNRYFGLYELTSCPFCGEAQKISVEEAIYDKGEFICRCRECLAITNRYDSPDKAAIAWNDGCFSDVTLSTAKDMPYTDDQDVWDNSKNSIVENAFDEYKIKLRKALRVWSQPSKYEDYMKDAAIDEAWFYSKYFKAMTNVDPISVVDAANKQARYEVIFRRPHDCDRCDNRECPNQKNIWWLWDRNNQYDICKGFTKKKRRYA